MWKLHHVTADDLLTNSTVQENVKENVTLINPRLTSPCGGVEERWRKSGNVEKMWSGGRCVEE